MWIQTFDRIMHVKRKTKPKAQWAAPATKSQLHYDLVKSSVSKWAKFSISSFCFYILQPDHPHEISWMSNSKPLQMLNCKINVQDWHFRSDKCDLSIDLCYTEWQDQSLSKQYAIEGQETFTCPLSKHMVYPWYRRWRENSTQVNKPEIVCPREMQYDYTIRAWETWLSYVFLKEEREKIEFFGSTFH